MKDNAKHLQRMLVIFMIKTGESLDWVLDQLANGKKIADLSPSLTQKEGFDQRLEKASPRRPSPYRTSYDDINK